MTSKSFIGLVVIAVIFGLPFSSARAELPPGSYDKLRSEAQDAIIIEVESVTAKELKAGWTEVILKSRVLAVERSKSALKRGTTITIRYESRDPNKVKFVGPRPVPILTKGEIYPAFLNGNEGMRVFEPAAFGLSFVMTPEG